jgi:hypothetical protein
MAQDIQPAREGDYYAAALRAPVHHRDSDFVMRYCTNNSEFVDGVLVMHNPPNPDQRAILRGRQASLAAAIGEHSSKAVASLIADMLGGYGTRPDETMDTMRKIVVKYVQELSDIPTWVVAIACRAIKDGVAPDISRDYRPTTIAVRHLCNKYLTPHRAELRQITAILTGKPYKAPVTPEQQAAVKARFDAGEIADAMRANGGSVYDRERDDLAQKVGQRIAAATNRYIERAWRDRGREPMCAGKLLVSTSLADKIAGRG